MKQICFCFLTVLLVYSANGQIGISQADDSVFCRGQRINVYAMVKGYAQQKEIHIREDSLLNGFSITLSDNSYKIIWFKILYEFPGDPIGEIIVLGDKVTPQNLSFLPVLNRLGAGEFYLSCIAIEKHGRRFKAEDFDIILDNK